MTGNPQWPRDFVPQILGDRPHQILLEHDQKIRKTRVACTCGAHLGHVAPEDGPDPVLDMHRHHLSTTPTLEETP